MRLKALEYKRVMRAKRRADGSKSRKLQSGLYSELLFLLDKYLVESDSVVLEIPESMLTDFQSVLGDKVPYEYTDLGDGLYEFRNKYI